VNWAPTSLRGRLLWLLSIGIAAVLLVQAVVSYRSTLAEADAILDVEMRQLGDVMQRAGSRMPAGIAAPEGSADDDLDMVIQSRDALGRVLWTSSPALQLPPTPAGFATALIGGQRYRVYTTGRPGIVVQVAQESDSRAEIARDLAFRMLWPTLLLGGVLLMVTSMITALALRPLARLEAEVAMRQPHDLRPVSLHGLPNEVRPLVQATNALMQRMQDAYEQQRQFVADAAHELRTPLTALQLQADAIARAPDDAARALALQRQHQGIRRAHRLVEQLLALARQDATPASDALIDATSVVQHVLDESGAAMRVRGIRMQLAIEEAVRVTGDGEALARLVRNLVGNAIRHAPGGGMLRVALAQRIGGSEFIVEDNGPGIPVEERDLVFERFHRGSTSEPGGSGLGLAIVRAAADSLHASINLGESSLGGLRVVVRFPLPRPLALPHQ